MKSTIEKAQQRQKEAQEAEKAKLAAAEQDMIDKSAEKSADSYNNDVENRQKQTSLERAAEKRMAAAAEKNVKPADKKKLTGAKAADYKVSSTNARDKEVAEAKGKTLADSSSAREAQANKLDENTNPQSQNLDHIEGDEQQTTDEGTEQRLGETQHIEIDIERLENIGFVTLTNARRQINEEYREIKRKLIQNAFGPLSKTLPNSNIIMVSSARPSEGKTFTAINLALSIAAEQDKTVLLVDADVLKPNVLRTLGVPEKKGLMDYLLGELNDISEVIYKTNVPKLRIIPAGSSHHLSTELLASGIMGEIVNEFSTRYNDRVVIIDTPPLIGINESAVLASFAGQALIVVEEGRTKIHDIQHSVERLNPDMAIGFVVNKSIRSTETGGYLGYGYGYGYYGSTREES
jgi:exopolysaccharide/PEP-CTERM locus tyrosine autokinase